MALSRGRGVAERAAVGAIQPEFPGCVASCWYSSRLTESAGSQKGRLKRATLWPRHLVRGAGAVGDSK